MGSRVWGVVANHVDTWCQLPVIFGKGPDRYPMLMYDTWELLGKLDNSWVGPPRDMGLVWWEFGA